MNTMAIRTGALATAAFACMLALAGPLAAQVDMTGTWALEVDVAGQVSTPSMTLQQNGNDLTGTYTSATLGEAEVTGTVSGNTVTVTFEVDFQGQGGAVSYIGEVGADGVWSGQFDLSGLADGPFTGKKSS